MLPENTEDLSLEGGVGGVGVNPHAEPAAGERLLYDAAREVAEQLDHCHGERVWPDSDTGHDEQRLRDEDDELRQLKEDEPLVRRDAGDGHGVAHREHQVEG